MVDLVDAVKKSHDPMMASRIKIATMLASVVSHTLSTLAPMRGALKINLLSHAADTSSSRRTHETKRHVFVLVVQSYWPCGLAASLASSPSDLNRSYIV